MSTTKKTVIGGIVVIGLVAITWASIYQANKDVVTVQTGTAKRQDLTSIVTASGEIRPLTYSNILGEGIGKITEIVVKEGDHVRKGDVLMRLESVQPAADVQAQEAGIMSADSSAQASDAALKMAKATLVQRKADLEKAKFDWERGQNLYKAELISKQDFDASKATYDSAVAAVDAAEAQMAQSKAMAEGAKSTLQQNQAVLLHQKDVLRKTTYTAPIDGIVSYIAVRVGENVVPGIQNAEGSNLMTISDMSIVTAEVKVDETDITNVRENQPAEVTIDALPGKTFKGHVTQVGELAILRSSGQAATTQTTANTQEARDFKVVVTVDNPPEALRPGLSATAKIQTAEKKDALTIPIQALAVRTEMELEQAKPGKKGSDVTLAASKPSTGANGDSKKTDIQGVFVIHEKKAEFVPVQTGIAGVTDIEVTSGLKDGDEIVIGSYKALRTLRPGAAVKVDNSAPKREESST